MIKASNNKEIIIMANSDRFQMNGIIIDNLKGGKFKVK